MADETGFTSAGSFLQISPILPATRDAAGFGAVTGFIDVSEMDDISGIEATTQTNSRKDLKTGTTRKVAGSSEYAPIELNGAFVRGDPGQVLAETKRRSRAAVSFCLNYADGGKEYGVAVVTKVGRPLGDADTFTGFSVTLDPDGETVMVDPV